MKRALLVSFIRFPLLIAALLLLAGAFRIGGLEIVFPFMPDASVIYFTAANIVCFLLMGAILRREGRTFRDIVGFRRERLGKDVLFGLLWLFVLYIPFFAVVNGMMFLLFGADYFMQFQSVFVGAGTEFPERPAALMGFAAALSLLFPFLNAPVEEIMYRGYAQPMLMQKTNRLWIAVLIPSAGFALQHVLLAGTWQGALVFAAAFFVWGIGSGVIYHLQKRLFPLIVCHFLVNLAFSAIPILFLLQG